MQIYIDIIFLINFIMDTSILFLISILDGKPVKKSRIIVGGLVGALLYCLLIVVPVKNTKIFVVCCILILIIMIYLSFLPKSLKNLFRLVTMAGFSFMFAGGLFISSYYIVNSGYLVPLSLGNFSLKMFLLLTVVFYLIIRFVGRFISALTFSRQLFCPLEICLNKNTINLMALLDTGNGLIKDSDGYKIIISEFSAVKNLFSPEIQELFFKRLSTEEIYTNLLLENNLMVKLVPFSSLGATKSFAIGLKIDYAKTFYNKEQLIKPAFLLIYNEKLGFNKGYNSIINPLILEE